jgi:seryl-tRNA synthetase
VLNPELLRRDPHKTRAALARRGEDAVRAFDAALEADGRWRQLTAQVESLRAERKQRASGRRGKPAAEEIEQERQDRANLSALEQQLQAAEAARTEALSWVPNLPDPAVPPGKDDTDNELVRTWGEPRPFTGFEPLPHWELAERLGILDLETGADLSGARFFVLKGLGAQLQRALINFMLDLHVREQGYTEVHTPYIVKEDIMYGSGQLPKFRDNLYHDAEDDLFLIPTSEVPLVNLYHDRIIAEPLPLKVTAQSPCFRKERAAAGRDVRGIKRVKQFYKVEMVRFVEPEASQRHLDELVADAEAVLQRLELPYQVVMLCTGDLGFAATQTYDLNIWAAGSGEWLECSSCSNDVDYQARRANIRFRRAAGGKTEFPHILNGSGVALPRTIIALLENNQQPDGSVVIPAVLRPYMGGLERITPANGR